ncbi:hypothetical protein OROGR_029501 [Orobanche gracilis]
MINGAIIRRRLGPRVSLAVLLSCTVLLSCSTVFISAAVVTLASMEIFKTHEWLPSKPIVYFNCKGEDRIILPDVKEKNVLYNFKGEESWQPLTELRDKKCKRCGFYEKDAIKTEVFDEWEFCPLDFTKPDGRYFHFKDREFNATFLCPQCVSLGQDHSSDESKIDSERLHWAIIAAITIIASAVFIAGIVGACKYRQKRKRQQEQARFLKLFEEVDDDEDELGISPLSHAI